ncbi:MAG: type IV pilin [Thermoplasmata archaeon]
MRKPWAIRKDQAAVSPVIATILMVAITVVLAAVLYVMVSGLVSGPGSTPEVILVSVRKTTDGTNWELTFQDVPTGKSLSSVYLIVFYGNGTVALTKTALSSLSGNAQFVQIDTSATSIQAGDRLLLSVTTYAAGSTFQLVDDNGVLATGTLQ